MVGLPYDWVVDDLPITLIDPDRPFSTSEMPVLDSWLEVLLVAMNQLPKMPEQNRIAELYAFSKDKIGRELGYPLKRALLDSALHSASVYSAVYSVRYLGHRNPTVVLDASFTPEWSGHPTVRGRCSITVWAVPSQQRNVTEQILVAEGLSILCRWLARTQDEGNAWRGSEHMLNFKIQDGSLRHSEQ